ncbi:hypothetical protein [Nocardia sp. NPDC020380]|uniref:hypothetical protein n=1 Tax=Nocardia sp. NPDC020380 TaxID=3364309 RepID=UPI003788AAF9
MDSPSSKVGLAALTTAAATATSHAIAMHSTKGGLTQGYSAAFVVATGLYAPRLLVTVFFVKPMRHRRPVIQRREAQI